METIFFRLGDVFSTLSAILIGIVIPGTLAITLVALAYFLVKKASR